MFTLKQKARMVTAARVVLILFWAMIVVSGTALLIGRAEAATAACAQTENALDQ